MGKRAFRFLFILTFSFEVLGFAHGGLFPAHAVDTGGT
ncbi:MAG: hypothetical protein H6Q86_1762 [candidate division NC10 bacterium]|jgi:hypothetical protein|nr:hypothetical protein [candidate division NC10 bacterium]